LKKTLTRSLGKGFFIFEGKAVSNRNGWKGDTRPLLRQLAKTLRTQREWLDDQSD